MDPVARTRLEQLIRSSDQSIREHCDSFNRTAQAHDEPGATLSYRQLTRWLAGEVLHARAASMRVAGLHWGEPFSVLVGPPFGEPEARPPAARRTATVDTDGAARRHPSYGRADGLSVVRLDWREASVPGMVSVRIDLDGDDPDQREGSDCSSGALVLGLARVLAEMGDRVVGLQRALAGAELAGGPTALRNPARVPRHADPRGRRWWQAEPARHESFTAALA